MWHKASTSDSPTSADSVAAAPPDDDDVYMGAREHYAVYGFDTKTKTSTRKMQQSWECAAKTGFIKWKLLSFLARILNLNTLKALAAAARKKLGKL